MPVVGQTSAPRRNCVQPYAAGGHWGGRLSGPGSPAGQPLRRGARLSAGRTWGRPGHRKSAAAGPLRRPQGSPENLGRGPRRLPRSRRLGLCSRTRLHAVEHADEEPGGAEARDHVGDRPGLVGVVVVLVLAVGLGDLAVDLLGGIEEGLGLASHGGARGAGGRAHEARRRLGNGEKGGEGEERCDDGRLGALGAGHCFKSASWRGHEGSVAAGAGLRAL
mmetsp:Transcript_48956/g.106575  ORF Transcript_48956/g.106575 Transcript_48956/m.106575 type:complete len:220 (-) Transcript_48956:18-677(-)